MTELSSKTELFFPSKSDVSNTVALNIDVLAVTEYAELVTKFALTLQEEITDYSSCQVSRENDLVFPWYVS